MKFAPVALVAVLLLAGCTTAPEPTPEPTVTPTETETPVVATGVTVSGTGIAIVFDDGSTEPFPFSDDPAEAIEALTLAFGGGPNTSHSEELACQPSFDNAAWPGFGIRSNYANLPDGQKFAVTIDAATSGPLALSTSEGIAVGSGGDAAFEAIDNAKRDRKSDAGVNYDTIFFDVQSGGDSGGYLFAANDKVVTIIAPVEYATLDC